MEKTYKIKPLNWVSDADPDFITHESTGTRLYVISQEGDNCAVDIYDDAGDFIRESLDITGIDDAKRYCETHHLEIMKRNLIELT